MIEKTMRELVDALLSGPGHQGMVWNDDFVAECRARADELDNMRWRAMESAPMDGSYVILWMYDPVVFCEAHGRWDSFTQQWLDTFNRPLKVSGGPTGCRFPSRRRRGSDGLPTLRERGDYVDAQL